MSPFLYFRMMMTSQQIQIAKRFMRYVQIDTQSDPNSSSFPSTQKQKILLEILLDELVNLGIKEVQMDNYGYVLATIPANSPALFPTICFCAHVDTAPDCSGTNVQPILHESYNGGNIVLPKDPTQILSIEKYPYLKNHIGKAVITASGDTLLGADDKAGVAIIMEMASYIIQNPSFLHGTIKILFTPDEEVGRGTDFLNIQALGADFGYTLDGGELGTYEMETFSANQLTLFIEGVIAHPGYAKGTMQNAIKIACAIVEALPTHEWSPETTEAKQGFIHPHAIQGGAEMASIEFLVRDFDTNMLQIHADRLFALANNIIDKNPCFNKAKLRMEVKEQYRNMKEIIEQHPAINEMAMKAYHKAGLTPKIEPIRGGTDGSRMSFMGLPTPNIFTGMQAIHSKQEWIGVSDMEKAVEVLLNLVEIN